MKIPAHFPKWNQAIDGLDDPLRWTIDCELSRLPGDIVFPHLGEVWALRHDWEVPVVAWSSLPGQCTVHSGTVLLREGERVCVVSVDDARKAHLLNLAPVRYDELHPHIVPGQIRNMSGYLHYTIPANTAFLNEHFRLVEEAA